MTKTRATFTAVMPGLSLASILLRKKLDCRVKPGNDN